jgi:xanthine phosphoribosyltransferase
MTEKWLLSWDRFDRDMRELIGAIQRSRRFGKDSLVMGVPRGGLIPATMLSYALKRPLVDALDISVGGDNLSPDLIIVDDICDTGQTFRDYRKRYPRAFYIAPYAKPLGIPMVQLCVRAVPQSIWVVFPWAPGDEVNR